VNLSGAELEETSVDLSGPSDEFIDSFDLSNLDLKNTDLTGANLGDADLSGKDLSKSKLSDVNLSGSDLIKTNLRGADLTRTNLKAANLIGANLRNANLNEANLRGARLSKANLQNAKLSNVAVDGSTECTRLFESSNFLPSALDATARAYHDLKSAFANHGLVSKARRFHVHERRLRRIELRETKGRFSKDHMGSLASEKLTGYGVRPSQLGKWMAGLFFLPTVIYLLVGIEDSFVRTISYSVVTFTTTPPFRPTGMLLQIVVMLQAFLGTLSLITLGYIFSNRERF
jgi:hypothetical protein